MEGKQLLKILVIGDCVTRDTGFGNQTRFVFDALESAGHNVVVAGAGNKQLPQGSKINQHIISYHDAGSVDAVIALEKPDLCVMFSYFHNIIDWSASRLLGREVPCFMWVPWEADVVPEHPKSIFEKMPHNFIVHLTNYAKNLWGFGDHVIPHGVDTDVFKEVPNKKLLRLAFSRKHKKFIDENAVLFINVDRNDERKRWDLTYDFLRRLRDSTSKRVQLVAHTSLDEPGGVNHEALMELYGVTDIVVHTNQNRNGNQNALSKEDYASLFSMADFRISTSMGEGFGIPTIEAFASGCVNIVPDNTCYKEIAEECAIPSSNRAFHKGLCWNEINVSAMVDTAVKLIKSEEKYSMLQKIGFEKIKSKYGKDVVGKMWSSLVEGASLKKQRLEYPYGLRSDETQKTLAYIISHTLIDLRVDSATVVNNDGIADYLRLSGNTVTSIESRSDMTSKNSCLYKEFLKDIPFGKVAVLVDCLVTMCPETFNNTMSNINNSEHLILRFDDTVSFHETRPSIGVSLTSLLQAGFQRNKNVEDRVLIRCKAQVPPTSKFTDIARLEVWSRSHAI